jgi:hypothetical protein
MAQLDNRYARATTAPVGTRAEAQEVDQGLRAYMLGVYNYMALGVALTGVVAMLTAYAAATNPAVQTLLYASPLKWVIMLAPLGMVFLLSFGVNRMSLFATQVSFWIYAALVGLSLSAIFLVFTSTSIAQVFFATAAAFAGLSLWGYTTKTNLSAWGSFLFMGLIGIIVASIINIFVGSSALQFAISVIGVLVFAGLTAYDTQRIKEMYFEVQHDAVAMGKSAVMGALSLYLDFINMFVMLLQLFGNRE